MLLASKQSFESLIRGNIDKGKKTTNDEDDVFGPEVPASPGKGKGKDARKSGMGKLKWMNGKGFVLGRGAERG